MLVGPTGGGKSSNLHVLEETLTRLKRMGKEVMNRGLPQIGMYVAEGNFSVGLHIYRVIFHVSSRSALSSKH